MRRRRRGVGVRHPTIMPTRGELARGDTKIERMFDTDWIESSPGASPALGSAIMLRRVAPPDSRAMWSLSARTVLLAAQGNSWVPARVLAWTWNPSGRPAVWRCAVDLGGQVDWYAYDPRLLRPLGHNASEG